MRRKMIVTGAAGFIGSHLVRALLSEGHDVVGIDDFDPFYDRALKEANVRACGTERFRLVEADVCDGPGMRDLFAARRPDTVFHVAALAGVRPSILDPGRFVRVNVDGLASILEATRHAGCGRLVFASSSSVYGDRADGPFAETDDVSRPISPYAATKRAGELLASTWCSLFGLSVAALRFFTVYGPGQRPDLAINLFMRRIAAGEPVPVFGDGSSSRDYTYVDDVIDGVLAADALLRERDAGFFRIYNLGGANPVRLDDLVARVARVVGRPARIDARPRQAGDVQRTWADLSRSRAELGYAPKMEIDEGLRRQWEWARRTISPPARA